jgi:glycosyltransferase involved in cell wall biosynthesis
MSTTPLEEQVIMKEITPVVLTFNEEANLSRSLAALTWADRVVVVDSYSTDATIAIARSFTNVSWYERRFDNYEGQWEHALRRTSITTPWVLALDADMIVTPALKRELACLVRDETLAGALVPFRYAIRGCNLPGSILPAQLRLFRLGNVTVGSNGHAHAFRVQGRLTKCQAALLHDDRKPLERFLASQLQYSAIELSRLSSGESQGAKSWLRWRLPITPFLVGLAAWCRAGGPFGGAAARRYALERLMYESLLRWRIEDLLVERRERPDASHPDPGSRS